MSAALRKIRLLDPHTINQIAAGEVVERPASVVKELVENALDAGSTRVEVELLDSGRTLIRVSDNGSGMSLEDAQTALQRHATSKIRSVTDLHRIDSLGFRGEALPSIASVSRMKLATSEEDGLRNVLRIEGGQVESPAGESGPKGTEIVVEDLFFNTPARLKFLKTDTTELSAVVETVSKYAVVYPEVAISMRQGGQSMVNSSGTGDPLMAISEIWGREIARSLVKISFVGESLRVRGFVSPPHMTKPTRNQQWVFVNRRPVRSRTIMAAIDQAYRSLTPEKRYPIAVLMIDIDPARVDANVSPTKNEVRFQQEGQVFDAVRHAIKSALLEVGMVPSADDIAVANAALSTSGQIDFASLVATAPREAPIHLPSFGAFAASLEAQAPLQADPFAPSLDGERFPFAGLLEGLKILGQIMNTFIIAETRGGLAIIDQHVAHERVLYEYLCGIRGRIAVEKQALLTPDTLHLDRRAASLLGERIDELSVLGFDIETFGGESFLVRSVPAALRGQDPLQLLGDLADELINGPGQRRIMPAREQIWIMCSCKMAVKAGDPLSLTEMEKLITDLAQTENPYLCPHGRPITVTLSRDDLLRKFKRT